MVINLYYFSLFSLFFLISSVYSAINIIFFPVVIFLFVLICVSSIKIRFNIPLVFYIYFILLLYFSLSWTMSLSNSLIQTVFISLIYLSILTFYFILSNEISKVEKFIFIIVLGSIVVNFRNLLLFFNDFSGLRFGGVTEQPNALALMSSTFLVLSILYLYLYKPSPIKKILVFISLLLSAFFLIKSGSRGGVISSFLFVFMLYFSFNKILNLKFISFLFLTIFLISYNFNYILEQPFFQRILLLPQALGLDFFNYVPTTNEYRFAADDTRVVLADIAINKYLENPLTGYGINSFGYFSEYNYTHNNFLEILFSLGFLGIFIFYFPLLMIFFHTFFIKENSVKAYIKVLRALIIYYLISGMSIPNFQSKIQLFIIVLILCFYGIIFNKKTIEFKIHKC